MIDFSLTEDQQMIVKMAREFALKEILPKAMACDEEHRFPEEVLAKAQTLGLVNAALPAEYGGGDMGPLEMALISEELGYACVGIAGAIMINNLGTAPLNLFGSVEQKKAWLPRICEERLLVSLAITEPQAGSDLGGLKTTYKNDGKDYRINGRKAWISNGNRADLFVVLAYPEGHQQLSRLSLFLVPASLPGVIRGRPERKLGLAASDTAGVVFEDVRIPADHLLGREGQGYPIVAAALDRGRTGTAAAAVGLQRRCVDECLGYSLTRRLGDKALGDHPVIRQMIAEMHLAVEASRGVVWKAAWKAFRGEDFSREASVAKAFSVSNAEKTALKAVEVMGAAGVSLEYPVAKLVNDAKVLSLVEGTTEIQKQLIAESLYAGLSRTATWGAL